jgi:hypothetical protein
VPDFARHPMTLTTCAVYRLRRGAWLEVGRGDVDGTFRIA